MHQLGWFYVYRPGDPGTPSLPFRQVDKQKRMDLVRALYSGSDTPDGWYAD